MGYVILTTLWKAEGGEEGGSEEEVGYSILGLFFIVRVSTITDTGAIAMKVTVSRL